VAARQNNGFPCNVVQLYVDSFTCKQIECTEADWIKRDGWQFIQADRQFINNLIEWRLDKTMDFLAILCTSMLTLSHAIKLSVPRLMDQKSWVEIPQGRQTLYQQHNCIAFTWFLSFYFLISVCVKRVYDALNYDF